MQNYKISKQKEEITAQDSEKISEKIRKSKSVLSVDELKKIIENFTWGIAYCRTTNEELQKANKHSINPKNEKDVSKQERDKNR